MLDSANPFIAFTSHFQRLFCKYRLPLLSGVFIGTTYMPFPPWALIFCFVPLWLYWLRSSSYRDIFIGSWFCQFVLTAIGGHWVAYAGISFTGWTWTTAIAGYLVFCSIVHLYIPVAGCVWKFVVSKLKVSRTLSILLIPSTFALCEKIYPSPFEWNLGYPWLWARLPGFQLTDLFGFFGLHFITLNLNAAILVYLHKREEREGSIGYLIATLLAFCLINLAGSLHSPKTSQQQKKLVVAVIQGNIGRLGEAARSAGSDPIDYFLERYWGLSELVLQSRTDIDLIIWPEGVFPVPIEPGVPRPLLDHVAASIEPYRAQLITGALEVERSTKSEFNSLVLLDGNGVVATHRKQRLFAFGEYIPFGESVPALRKIFKREEDLNRGSSASVIKTDHALLGAQVCYEGLFDSLAAEQAKSGTQIFVNISSDSKFGYPFEPIQHLYMTLARSVEFRIPLVRATTTGFSAAILADGTILERSPHSKAWFHVYEIPISSEHKPTLYAYLSKAWTPMLTMLIIITLLVDRLNSFFRLQKRGRRNFSANKG